MCVCSLNPQKNDTQSIELAPIEEDESTEDESEEARLFDDDISGARPMCDVAFLLHLYARNHSRTAHLMLVYMSKQLKNLLDGRHGLID